MKNYKELVADSLQSVPECMAWDLEEKLNSEQQPLLLDIREGDEFDAMHIEGSIHVPRGILEGACDWGYDDTIPELVQARDKEVVVICRSGNRSALAAEVMQKMGYKHVISLQGGLRGWNDYDQPMLDKDGNTVDPDEADEVMRSKVSPEQMGPSN
ncbi:MAG: rhodanese-like domain-containing protein [Gammaproteobacteria bacterium]|nr:rhodanese-like domain-containing protein [Gammaproteobacteria bacterium]